jgi:phosphopantothenoylcysteine decarboxylase/phosphopantothenate--cysteine ligase
MSKSKILIGITGSIAAYKSAYLISKLVQNNFEVKIVATEYALKFIGKATLEGLSGSQVYTDSFEEGKMMSHINLVKWADLTIVCPASANTINKMAAGISDNLLTSLFLAHDWNKPYLIVPAMNTNMFEHPATQSSIKKLETWGVQILPTAEGYLACGDIGKGKMIEPDEIYERILISLSAGNKPKKKLNILITAGGTKESIDGVRYISNLSTGKTAASIADYFLRRNHDVTFLHSADSAVPYNSCKKIKYNDFNSLNENLKNILSSENFDVIIHNAAVSDYSLESINIGNEKHIATFAKKINSEIDSMTLNLRKNEKLIDKLKEYSSNKKIKLIGFKFTSTDNVEERENSVKNLFAHSGCDFIVLNDRNNRDENNQQKNFSIYDADKKLVECSTSFELAKELEVKLTN